MPGVSVPRQRKKPRPLTLICANVCHDAPVRRSRTATVPTLGARSCPQRLVVDPERAVSASGSSNAASAGLGVLGHQRAEARAEFRAGGARGHGPAMEATVEHDDVRAPGGLTAEPQRRLDRTLPEFAKNIRSRPGGNTSPSADQGKQWAVQHRRVSMDQRADLSLRGFDHPRVSDPYSSRRSPR